MQGGHRVGVTGKVILNGDRIKGMKYISCINVRLSHQLPGCADAVMPYIQRQNHIAHTLIISPPRGGKTTLLRDVIRQLSNGREGISGVTVGVVDERSETLPEAGREFRRMTWECVRIFSMPVQRQRA